MIPATHKEPHLKKAKHVLNLVGWGLLIPTVNTSFEIVIT
jgi:hypothetical protein